MLPCFWLLVLDRAQVLRWRRGALALASTLDNFSRFVRAFRTGFLRGNFVVNQKHLKIEAMMRKQGSPTQVFVHTGIQRAPL